LTKPAPSQQQFDEPVRPVDDEELAVPTSEVVFTGRNVEIPDHFQARIAAKLARLERFDVGITRFDVELEHEPNRRQAKNSQRVEITVHRRGPVVRAQTNADNFYAAFESVMAKLERRLRRVKERRIVHQGGKRPMSVAESSALAAASLPQEQVVEGLEMDAKLEEAKRDENTGPGRIVRRKAHSSKPMTTDEALYEMELVGHDFFLFQDKETGKPSVVYRRHAFDYGLLTLD
jgi:ribosomal subunit interface protein